MLASEQDQQSEFRRKLGMALLLLGVFGLLWISVLIYQLWYTPKSVPFVSMVIEFLEQDQKPVMKDENGREINIPESWPVVVGIFLSIVLISSMSFMVHALISAAISLLFPDLKRQKT